MNVHKKTFQYGPHSVTLETGRLARQADGAALVSMGDTVVLVTAVGRKEAAPGKDFLPLTVNYVEKTYAAGRIPGGFFKREGRPTEKETLTSRLIDRPIRPLFPEGFYNEVQVIATVISLDPEIDSDVPAMLGASAALCLSGMPFKGPIGAARVGYHDGKYLLNPTAKDLQSSSLDLVVAGTADAVLMVESEAERLPESVMLGAVVYGHEQMQVAIRAIRELAAEAGKPAWQWSESAGDAELAAAVAAQAEAELTKAYALTEKQARYARIGEVKAAVVAALAAGETPKFDAKKVSDELGRLEYNLVRRKVLAGDAHRRARHAHRAPDHRRDRRAATHARLGALHPRRDAGAGDDHARHRPRRADHRCAVRRAQRALHAALQLPAVLGERGQHAARAEAPRDRPRQPGPARHQRRHAGHGQRSHT